MAKFCSVECEEVGAICDFCIYYQDEYRDILQNGSFAGEGICGVTTEEVSACDGYNCEKFECFKLNIEEY
ncbi:hypothetical protein [Clostridium cuniculi]|uniref:hypothetical protein n=1 Tax=Clostridium cuniculi TaxID=2548455 RepID=UPI0010565F08|nr:hypothetical protein [Clostridium cuniculi]